ncbi:MAG: arginine--tRNA ligase [Clostridia bacterium]|nr:arginine--tRNA ligase [Clostridia bacterium]
MAQLLIDTKEALKNAVLAAVQAGIGAGEFPQAELPAIQIEIPADSKNGDFSTNAAMALARAFHNNPRKIAEIILAHIDLAQLPIEKCDIAGAGFINFYVGSAYYAAVVAEALKKGEAFGASDFGGGNRINVEFVSANPTGPMHMGNARGGALGDCLAAVLEKAGYYVEREFYVNDAGNQIIKFGLSLSIRYLSLFLPADDARCQLPEDAYHGADILERAKEFAAVYGDKYVDADAAEREQALIDFALPKNIAAMKELMNTYRITYNTWFLESTLHQGEIGEVIDILSQKGFTYEKDGALWFAAAKAGGEEYKDEVLVRSNGTPTYFAADIAYHRNKLTKRGFDKAIDIWGADHHGHVARLKNALNAVGENGDALDVVLMQLVRLIKDGKPAKMSKRTGKAITLEDLLNDIPADAVRFLFNMREATSQMDFDLDLAVEQSSQNPVYYVQYAHARICSVLAKLEKDGVQIRSCTAEELELLQAPEELAIIRHLAALTDEIITAAKAYDPARITRYVTTLATLFHKFYNAQRVAVDDEALMMARVNLCLAVKTTIKSILEMFKITAPEKM